MNKNLTFSLIVDLFCNLVYNYLNDARGRNEVFMKEFYTRFFLINLKDYYNLGVDLEINLVLLALLPVVMLIWIAFHLWRNNTFLVVKRLARRDAVNEDSAKTLRELGLNDKAILKWMLSCDGQLTKIVKRVGAPSYTYEEYIKLSAKERRAEKIDFETAKFYLDSEKQGTVDKIVNRYEVRPHHTVLMCVSIVVTFVCVILLMPDILYGLDWLIGFIKELDIFKK